MPGTKRPGSMSFGQWYGRSDWASYCDRLPTEHEIPIWERWADAGVCVAIDHTLKVIDIDTDDAAMMTAVLNVLPDSPVKKRGNKGFSAFYRGSPAIVNRPFSIPTGNGNKKERIVDLLAHGRQTVLPPTVHPDIQKPYEWLTRDTLLDTSISQLPVLPDNIADLIAEALTPYGYTPEENERLLHGVSDGDTLWREVNDTALQNLHAWVPDLRLPKTSRSGQGYRAVAIWRDVDNANLSFHKDGIKDWGNSESHTPIDVVIKSFNVDLYTATKWLCEQLNINTKKDDDFDIAGFIARSQAKSSAPATKLVAPIITEPFVAPVVAEDDVLPPVAAPRATVNPFDLSTQEGLLGEISTWIYSTARAPVAEFATIGALAFLAAFYGRRYVGPTGAALNVYLIGIAGPGFGKDHPRKCVEMLGYDANMQFLIGPNEVTSDSAIEKVVRKRPCFVMPWDEVGVMLQSVSGRQSQSWTRSIRKALLELYSRSTGVWTGKEHATLDRDASGDPVHCPTVSILGMSTPTEFYAGITDGNLQDGMVARMTIINAKKRPDRHDVPPILKVPPELIEKMKAAVAAYPMQSNLAGIRDPRTKPHLHAATWGEGAIKKWKAIEQWQLEQQDEKPEYEGIVGRCAEQTIKIATIKAISRDAVAPCVTVADVDWGYAIVQQSIDMIDDGVRNHMASSEFEALWKKILEVIKHHGDDGVARSMLLRKRGISKASPREFDSAIKFLENAGYAQQSIGTSEKGGRPGVRFKALKDAENAA